MSKTVINDFIFCCHFILNIRLLNKFLLFYYLSK